MNWPQVRKAYPDQWLVIEALEAHTEDNQVYSTASPSSISVSMAQARSIATNVFMTNTHSANFTSYTLAARPWTSVSGIGLEYGGRLLHQRYSRHGRPHPDWRRYRPELLHDRVRQRRITSSRRWAACPARGRWWSIHPDTCRTAVDRSITLIDGDRLLDLLMERQIVMRKEAEA